MDVQKQKFALSGGLWVLPCTERFE